jgi:hypothetical protein
LAQAIKRQREKGDYFDGPIGTIVGIRKKIYSSRNFNGKKEIII